MDREYGPNLQLLLAEETGPAIAELVSLPVAKGVIDEAEQQADYVIVDSPPLTQVIDALPLASHVDDVLLVVRSVRATCARSRSSASCSPGSA